jgi:hypothetical protein
MASLLNQALDWAQRWRDRGPVAQRLYPALPSGGTTKAPPTSGAQPSSLAAAVYPNLPSAGRAAPPTRTEGKP